MKYLPLVAITLVLTGCSRPEGPSYFPDGCFSSRDDLQELRAAVYTSKLMALQEAPLFAEKIDPKVESYRFTWLRTRHHPVVLRIDVRNNGNGKFTIKVADGRGGYDPGKLVRNESKDMQELEVNAMRARFNEAAFFDVTSYEESDGLDGSMWIIEAIRDGNYHIVSRWSPKEGPVRTIGMEFLKMASGGELTPIY